MHSRFNCHLINHHFDDMIIRFFRTSSFFKSYETGMFCFADLYISHKFIWKTTYLNVMKIRHATCCHRIIELIVANMNYKDSNTIMNQNSKFGNLDFKTAYTN